MIGTTLSHFKITAKLGEGGMGEVYRAEDTKLGREVAIKVLPEAVAKDPERLARFQREARVLASLNHPNIASIYGLEEADNQSFLVMELAEGADLTEYIARGPIPFERALPIALQIAEALEAADDAGIVHRDLKPANVKVTADGKVKVLDFGLAKALDPGTGAGASDSISLSPTLTAQMTQAGVLLGTAAYMSPEQARGEKVDRRSDIWAFGIVLMEMLTGERVYAGRTVSDTLAGILTREPDWEALPRALPTSIRRLLERCLEKEARDRLQAIGEARITIADALVGPRSGGVPHASSARTAAPLWRRALPWLISAAAVTAAIALWILLRRAEEVPAPPVTFSVEISDRDLMSGYGMPVALSPQGEWLVYAVGGGSHPLTLSLRRLDGADFREVVGPDEGGYHPFFSPDGEWLGFVTVEELKKISVHGGTSTSLAPVNRSRGADWGPDGTIVYAPTPAGPLYRVAGSGQSEPEQLSELAEGERSHRWPRFLPGGQAIVFTAHEKTSDFSEARPRGRRLERPRGERALRLHRNRSAHLRYRSGDRRLSLSSLLGDG